MATIEQQPTTGTCPPASVVGNAFVFQYYHILYQSPELGHRFYQDISMLGRPEEDGHMSTTTTMQAINEKIMSMRNNDPDCKTEITSVDALDSYNGGVLVVVIGVMTGKSNNRRKFTQTFFLAPQDKGYFVLNDILRYVDESTHQEMMDVLQAFSPTEEDTQVSEQISATTKDNCGGEGYNPPENVQETIEDAEAQEPDVAVEVPDDSQDVTESTSSLEEMPKKSYASIVKVSPAVLTMSASSAFGTASKTQENQVAAAHAPDDVSEKLDSSINANETVYNQDSEATGYSIYIKGLPQNATHALVENEFQKFGPIKSNGVQVKVQKGFCFGFVEFEAPDAVQSALKASPILMNGRQVFVEEKRSTNRGNVRGGFSSGRGTGYRNEGTRGRVNFNNGRNFGRGDFNGWSDYGNRNRSISYHGGDGFPRGDQMGSHGSRYNRSGSMSKSA